MSVTENAVLYSLPVFSGTADIPVDRFVVFENPEGVKLPDDSISGRTRIVGITAQNYIQADADAGQGRTVLPIYNIDASSILRVEFGGAVTLGQNIISGLDGRAYFSGIASGSSLQVPDGDYQVLGTCYGNYVENQIGSFIAFRGPIVTIS